MRTFRNPIFMGFYPDPSICSVGKDHCLVDSTLPQVSPDLHWLSKPAHERLATQTLNYCWNLSCTELALPLISCGEIISVLTIQSRRGTVFSEEDISVMQTMADQPANAITNARLYERAQQAYAEVEQQGRERTAELKREQEESTRLQQELSTLIVPVLEGVIGMPLIGTLVSLPARNVIANS